MLRRMTLRRRNKIAIVILCCVIVLNCIAAFLFSFLSLQEILLIYAVNFLPVALLVVLLRRQRKRREIRGGFVFLYLVLFKIVYILSFLFFYSQMFVMSKAFLINFLLVYLLFLCLSIFIGIGFLSDKNKG